MVRATLISLTLACAASAASAQVRPETEALLQTMRLPDLIAIMREEGIVYGASLEEELFPTPGGAAWSAVVEQTYDGDRMYKTFATRFDAELDPDKIEALSDFFVSDRGQRIMSFEISARRALLDKDVEAAAIEAYEAMAEDGHPRLEIVKEYIEVNDLVESNVMGAMNANFAFYSGLIDGNAFPSELTEEQILADVWSQEPQIREDTVEWVYSYLLMAYQPLSDNDLDIYIALSRSDDGRALNRALFAAFDDVFVEISKTLGLASARFLSGQDI
jgi:hypothetical protein